MAVHFVCITVTDWQWKVVAERLGLRANEIKFLDMRSLNPSGMTVDYLLRCVN